MKISDYFFKPIPFSFHPIDRRMNIIKENGIEGMSSENIRFLMNEICRLYCKELYVEVGSWKGCSLISSALWNYHAKFIGIDNFSQFESSKKEIRSNIKKMNLKNTKIINGNYTLVIPKIIKEKSIDVYFYDGEHDYKNQILGLDFIQPYLKDECIIFIDDASWDEPNQANETWLNSNEGFDSILLTVLDYDFESDLNNPCWWNGLRIITRGIEITI